MEENIQRTKKQTITHEKTHYCAPTCDPGSPECANIQSSSPMCFPCAPRCTKWHLCTARVCRARAWAFYFGK